MRDQAAFDKFLADRATLLDLLEVPAHKRCLIVSILKDAWIEAFWNGADDGGRRMAAAISPAAAKAAYPDFDTSD